MDMAHSFDAAMIDALLLVHSKPAIIRPFLETGRTDKQFKIDMNAHLENERREIEALRVENKAVFDKLNANLDVALVEGWEFGANHVSRLRAGAELIEQQCNSQAVEIAREYKKLRKLTRSTPFPQHLRKYVAGMLIELEGLMFERMDMKLNASLAFRAIASSIDPDRTVYRVPTSEMSLDELLELA